MNKKIKFGIFADLHVDIMHDTQERLEAFLDACRKEDVDFIIHLGDFCYPDEDRKCVCSPDKRPINIQLALERETYADKQKIMDLYNSFEKPSYHVLGNHDADMCTKKQTLDFCGSESGSYYSFDMGGFHFIVLDPNYCRINGEYIPFENGNYFEAEGQEEKMLPFLPPEQIKWLEEDLAKTKFPSVLFSHQHLGYAGCGASIVNVSDVKPILANAPSGVAAAFCGHQHADYVELEDNIWFVNINSMSNYWLGPDFVCEERYTKEIDEMYPCIKYTVPYRDALFAFVTLDENGIDIKGRQSDFVGISPKEQGLYNEGTWFSNSYKHKYDVSASIKDRYLSFDGKMIVK